VWLLPISLWETAVLHRRGRIRLTVPVREWVRTALDSLPTQEAPLIHEVALLSEELELGHADPVDRFLAASALVDELRLVTMDGRLTASEWLPTLTA
jgi:PIN domain nuclease of toxin-antitoxin system